MDGRWKCQSEGLTRRTLPNGRTVWAETPRTCPAGHTQPMRPDWRRCADCGFVCRHWDCPVCGREERSPLHVCDPDGDKRPVDQHRR